MSYVVCRMLGKCVIAASRGKNESSGTPLWMTASFPWTKGHHHTCAFSVCDTTIVLSERSTVFHCRSASTTLCHHGRFSLNAQPCTVKTISCLLSLVSCLLYKKQASAPRKPLFELFKCTMSGVSSRRKFRKIGI